MSQEIQEVLQESLLFENWKIWVRKVHTKWFVIIFYEWKMEDFLE